MPRFLIDTNLPYYFSLWNNEQYIHQRDIDSRRSDSGIWEYAKQNNLIIITKDADFSDRILLLQAPPKVIHIRLGNRRMREFHQRIVPVWEEVCRLIEHHKLIYIFDDRIEAIE
jgi:predicted nuclease of predicted toxin-antitoxin system